MAEWNQDAVAVLLVISRLFVCSIFYVVPCFGEIRKRFNTIKTSLKAVTSGYLRFVGKRNSETLFITS